MCTPQIGNWKQNQKDSHTQTPKHIRIAEILCWDYKFKTRGLRCQRKPTKKQLPNRLYNIITKIQKVKDKTYCYNYKAQMPKYITKYYNTTFIHNSPFRTTITWDLFLLERKLVIIRDLFTSRYMPFCIDKYPLLALNTYNFGVTIRLYRKDGFAISYLFIE